MYDSKPWFHSRTIWAALVSVGASLGAFVGFDADEQVQSNLTDAALQLVAALTAIFGRITARAVID